jgi:Ca-activated chloride channel family protein
MHAPQQNYSESPVEWRFEQPWWFLLAVGSLPVIVLGASWMQAMSPTRRWLSVLLRVALMCLIAAVLARPHSVRTTNTLAVVAVVDVSGSVRTFAGSAGADIIEQVRSFVGAAAAGRGDEDLMGLVVFDGRSIVVSRPTRVDLATRSWDQQLAEGTDIAAALRLARSIIPPDASGRILLVSDGNQTAGDAISAAAEFGAGGAGSVRVPIDTITLGYSITREVAVEQVDAPQEAKAGSTIPVRVALNAAGPARGFLTLTMDDQAVDLSPGMPGDARPITLEAGLNVERIEVQLDDRRVHRFRAVFEPETGADASGRVAPLADTVAENNAAEAFTLSPGRGSVLIVDGVGSGEESGRGGTLARTLRLAGLTVRIVPSSSVPGDLLALQEFDAVVLQNVPADAVPESAQIALAAYVQDLGGGLLMTGGPTSFGAGGWKGSKLEPILPVRLDLPERLIASQVAIVFVLDNSGSMWRYVMGSMKSQQEIANDAAATAIRTLERTDQVGVITFNNSLNELIQLGPNVNPDENARRVLGIMSGGGTNAYPAIERAGQWLKDVKAKHKHIVVLSDGRSQRANDLPELCERLAADDIKVSTIGVGDDADASTMALMARRGGGETYYVVNPSMLPQVFVKAVRVVRTPLIREEPFVPVVLGGGSPLTAGLSTLPELGGLALTQVRTDATVVNAVLTPTGEPVLAHWQAGLGAVAAFTSDTHEWAKAWIDSPVYEQFWARIIRGIARPADAAQNMVATTRSVDGGIRIRLASQAGDGEDAGALSAKVTLYAPGGGPEPREVAMQPVGPGEFEAIIPASMAGSYVALIKPVQGSKLLPPLITGVSLNQGAEYRFRTSNAKTMEEISRRSGGRVVSLADPRGARLFDRSGVVARQTLLPLWHSLLFVLVGLLLADIANRRVAWDRWISALFGAGSRDMAGPSSVQVSARLAALRAAADERETPQTGPSIALGDMEARMLALQARDRRRAARLGQTPQSSADGAPIVETPPAAMEPASGLLAAKKRAGERFKDDQ